MVSYEPLVMNKREVCINLLIETLKVQDFSDNRLIDFFLFSNIFSESLKKNDTEIYFSENRKDYMFGKKHIPHFTKNTKFLEYFSKNVCAFVQEHKENGWVTESVDIFGEKHVSFHKDRTISGLISIFKSWKHCCHIFKSREPSFREEWDCYRRVYFGSK